MDRWTRVEGALALARACRTGQGGSITLTPKLARKVNQVAFINELHMTGLIDRAALAGTGAINAVILPH